MLEINQCHKDEAITDIKNRSMQYPEWQIVNVYTGSSDGDKGKHDKFVRLLAAAPELLEALEKLTDEADRVQLAVLDMKLTHLRIAIKQARSAIAKATNE